MSQLHGADPTPRLHCASVRLHEQTDDASRALGARRRAGGHDLGGDLVLGQTRRQLFRLEVSRHQYEGIMVRLHGGWGARAGIEADALRALATDVLVGLLADLAFREAGDVRRDAVGHPVIDARAATAFGV